MSDDMRNFLKSVRKVRGLRINPKGYDIIYDYIDQIAKFQDSFIVRNWLAGESSVRIRKFYNFLLVQIPIGGDDNQYKKAKLEIYKVFDNEALDFLIKTS